MIQALPFSMNHYSCCWQALIKKLTYELEISLQNLKDCKGNQIAEINEHTQNEIKSLKN
jgi:hypothetical protein